MSKALEILDERLAKGEINDAEYEKLKAKLGASAANTTAVQNNTPSTEKLDDSDPRMIKRNLAKILFSVGGLGLFSTLMVMNDPGGLNDTGQTIFTFSCIAVGIGAFLYNSSKK